MDPSAQAVDQIVILVHPCPYESFENRGLAGHSREADAPYLKLERVACQRWFDAIAALPPSIFAIQVNFLYEGSSPDELFKAFADRLGDGRVSRIPCEYQSADNPGPLKDYYARIIRQVRRKMSDSALTFDPATCKAVIWGQSFEGCASGFGSAIAGGLGLKTPTRFDYSMSVPDARFLLTARFDRTLAVPASDIEAYLFELADGRHAAFFRSCLTPQWLDHRPIVLQLDPGNSQVLSKQGTVVWPQGALQASRQPVSMSTVQERFLVGTNSQELISVITSARVEMGKSGADMDMPQGSHTTGTEIILDVLVDFPDDALLAKRTLTTDDIDALMASLKALGIRRVIWSYYGDGHGGMLTPAGYAGDDRFGWKHYYDTCRALGNPLKAAVAAGHRHGMEVYAYFKPYETGPAVTFPEGSPQAKDYGLLDCIGGKLAWLDPFVRDNPDLRIQRRSDDIPAWVATATVSTIRLTKNNARPTRITKEHLQIWVSPDNWRYKPTGVEFTFSESVEPSPCTARDQYGYVLTRQGDPVRVLTISGLGLKDKYILVTTDFADGTADFVNSGLAMMTALDPHGREIPGVFASHGAIWCANLVDFRQGGLMFDFGWGAMPVTLDAPIGNGKQGFIAFARGRNAHLPGALCETEPKVQEFWLRCLDEMIAAGVDGVDFREENHSTHTDSPEDYGFNPVVLEKCTVQKGDLLEEIAEVRGEAYTEFLGKCRSRLRKAGKRMRYNLQLDFFRPELPLERLLAYPANIHFDWTRWVDEGLMDEAILRFYSLPFTAVFDDRIAQEMIARCQKRAIPVSVNRYVRSAGENLGKEVQRVKADGRLSGFIFYEVHDFITFPLTPGACSVSYAPDPKAAAVATAFEE